MLSSLAHTAVKNKKIAPMMESFFTTYVLPEFKSPHGFLRYRVSCRSCAVLRGLELTRFFGGRQVCEVVEKYESCDMKWDKRAVSRLVSSLFPPS